MLSCLWGWILVVRGQSNDWIWVWVAQHQLPKLGMILSLIDRASSVFLVPYSTTKLLNTSNASAIAVSCYITTLVKTQLTFLIWSICPPPLQEEKHLEQKNFLKGVDQVSLEKGYWDIDKTMLRILLFSHCFRPFRYLWCFTPERSRSSTWVPWIFFPTELGSCFTRKGDETALNMTSFGIVHFWGVRIGMSGLFFCHIRRRKDGLRKLQIQVAMFGRYLRP